MRKKLTILLAAAMFFAGIPGQLGYAETAEEVTEIAETGTEDENIIRETGKTTIGGTTDNPTWLADDTTSAEQTLLPYVASSEGCSYRKPSNNDDYFCGISTTGSTGLILSDPNGAYLTSLTFYAYYRSTTSTTDYGVSVSDSLAGEYTPVTSISKERVAKLGGTGTHSVYKITVTDFQGKYVKLTDPQTSQHVIIGSLTYDWLKITDLSKIPDGTVEVSGTSNPYWMADSKDEVLKNFVEYSVSASASKAKSTVTAEDIANNKNIVGNPVNEGDISFVGISGDGKYAILEAPANSFIRRFKYYIYSVGGDTSGIAGALSVSNELDGTYTPVSVTIKKLGYVSGQATNHFLFEVETAEEINCKYVKLTIPTIGWPDIGAFEYDYKINKVGMALDKVFYSLDDILNGQDRMHVESDLNLFSDIEAEGKKYQIEWSSSDEQRVKPDGTVNQAAESKAVTVKATVNDDSGAEVYSKSYDITVAALGSTLIFRDDFETAEVDSETGTGKLTGYNEWTATYAEQTDGGVVVDPAGSANKALWTYREGSASGSDSAARKYDKITSGKVELSFKHKTTATSTHSRFGWGGLDIYMQARYPYGYVNSTSALPKTTKSVTWKLNVWHEYRFILDLDRSLISIYYNDEIILEDHVLPDADYSISNLTFSTKGGSNFGSSYYDDICIRNLTPPTDEAVGYDAQLINLPESTVNDIDLPTDGDFGSMIAWQSSDVDVIDNNGMVTQQAEDTDVTLHATVALGEYTEERDITVTVLGTDNTDYIERDAEALEGIADRFSLSKMLDGQDALNITDNITLPDEYTEGDAGRLGGCNISWNSDSDALTSDGTVTRGENDTKVTLTAEFSFKEDSAVTTERTYTFIVSGNGEYVYKNSFDGVGFGSSASELDGVSADKTEGSGVFYGAWQAPDDLLNGVLGATRSEITGNNSEAVLATDFSGEIAEMGMSFYMGSASDRIDISIDGVDIPVYVKSSAISVDGVIYDAAVTTKEWHKLVVRFDDYTKYYYVYLDGELVTNDTLIYKTDFTINSVTVSNDSSNGSVGAWYVDNVYIKDSNVSDEEAIQKTIEALDIADVAEWDIQLPLIGRFGAEIAWTSENPAVLDSDGVVNRKVGGDQTIRLTATISRGDVSEDKTFDILVPGLDGTETPTQEKFEEHVNEVEISEVTDEKPGEITKDLHLISEYVKGNSAFYGGMDVTWSSEFPKIISDDGKITRPMFDRGVTLTATFTSKRDPQITAQKEFDFTVLAPGEILCYEDFESVTEEMVGTNIDGYKDTWEFEKRTSDLAGQYTDLEIDPQDILKPFSEANKALRINRYRLSGSPERSYWVFTGAEKAAMLASDAVVFSFKVKFITAQSRLDFKFGGLSAAVWVNKISGTVNGRFADGALPVGEWHTLSFILCPTNEICYFLIDGKHGIAKPYRTFTDRLDVAEWEVQSNRSGSVSDIYIDDISIRILGENDDTAVAEAVSELSIPYDIGNSFELPAFGANRTTISWTSENPDIILDSGKVVGTGPALLKAIIKRGTALETKEFNVNVSKTGSYDFTVNSLAVSDGIISSANVSYTGDTTDAELIVLVYNKGKLVAMRSTGITGTTVTLDAIDVSEYYDGEIRAYVMKNSDIISNIEIMKLQ